MSEKPLHDSTQETVFDVDVEKLAKVYAQAGLDAAGDTDAQKSFVEELRDVVGEVLSRHPDLDKVLGSALVSDEDKLGIIDRVFGKHLSHKALNFLKVIARHGRLGILRQIVRNAIAMWTVRLNQVTVRLELAHPIDQNLQDHIKKVISEKLAADPVIDVVINPDLIGGFVVRAGDKVFDASTRANLERARNGMIERAIAAIEQRPDTYVLELGV